MKSLTVKGYWWLPSNSEHKVGGILEFDPNSGGILSVIGELQEETDALLFPKQSNLNIVHGITTDGKPLSLRNCSVSNAIKSVITTAEYRVQMVIEGHHFSTDEDLKFDTLNVYFSNLEDWTGLSGIVSNVVSTSDTKQHVIAFEFPKTIEFTVNDIEISIELFCQMNYNVRRNYNLREHPYFRIRLPQLTHLNETWGILNHLQNLLSLATNRSIFILELSGTNSSITRYNGYEEKASEINLLYKVPNYDDEVEAVHPATMLFTLADVQEHLSESISNWFEKSERIKPVVDLFFSTAYKSFHNLETDFLSMTQALETYHRRQFGGTYLDQEVFEENVLSALIKAIPNDLNASYKDVIKGKLKYFNQYSQRKRFKEVLQSHLLVIQKFIPDVDDFVTTVVNVRNYLTHYEESERNPIRDYRDLLILLYQLKMVIESCFLKEIGFEVDEIKNIINEAYKYNRLFSTPKNG